MLSSLLCLGHLSSYFPSGFFTKILHAFLFFPLWPTFHPSYCPWFIHSNKFSMLQVKNCILINILTLVVASLPCTNYKIKLVRETMLYTTVSYKIHLVHPKLMSMYIVVGCLIDYIHRTAELFKYKTTVPLFIANNVHISKVVVNFYSEFCWG